MQNDAKAFSNAVGGSLDSVLKQIDLTGDIWGKAFDVKSLRREKGRIENELDVIEKRIRNFKNLETYKVKDGDESSHFYNGR